MHFCCQICGSWTVKVARTAETWFRADGAEFEFNAGTCTRCDSFQLIEPTAEAIELAAERMQARAYR